MLEITIKLLTVNLTNSKVNDSDSTS
jgi:hypothetical protein